VFVNLVDNALKFSREARAPQVEVGATLQQGQTVFFVRDNGVGFESAATDGARLFEPFERLHGTRDCRAFKPETAPCVLDNGKDACPLWCDHQ